MSNKRKIILGIIIGINLLIIINLYSKFNKYYFNKEDNNNFQVVTNNNIKKGKYRTVIIYDNIYEGVNIKNTADAYSLIVNDSVNQKISCPSDIIDIENEMVEKYGIMAVNLCEMDISFAHELSDVFKKIAQEYPTVSAYLTNVTLVNGTISNNYIAAFMPIFKFAKSSSQTTYPWIIKTQILLNTNYFLNQERLKSAVIDSSNSGHFPKNATLYSPVAHELGHYLSFIAMIRSYNTNSILLIDTKNITNLNNIYSDFDKGIFSLQLLKEAYNNYLKDMNDNIPFDDWRGTISNYATAKDNNGTYIYDETVAEAFHDVYLNSENASLASRYIVNVLKKYLGRVS